MKDTRYYIDGNFESDSLRKEGAHYYSSSYSHCMSSYEAIELDAELQQKIKGEAFNRVISFYNDHDVLFQAFHDKLGVDPWFLEHFRLTFKYRNFQFKLAAIKQFLSAYPNGKVITADRHLKRFIAEDRLVFQEEVQTNQKKTKVSKEIRYILGQWKPRYKQDKQDLLLSVWDDNIEGIDKRFGALNSSMDKLLNRAVFNPRQELPSETSGYRSQNNVDQVIACYLLSVKAPFHFLRFRKELKNLFNQLNASRNDLIPEDQVILAYFQAAQFSLYVYFIRYRAFKRFFQKSNYRSVSFINENSAQQRVVQYAAHQTGVKTIGVQHGAIYPSHPAYMYGEYKTKPILPDLTFVWGEHYWNMLVEFGGYSNKQVVTSGRIPAVNPQHKKHSDLTIDKKCIVYATQPQPDMNLRKRELKTVLNAARLNVKDCYLVLRPHPAEVEDVLFLEIANEVGFTDFLIDRTSDLTSHFEAADIFITSYSTVGAEFVPYNKPLIVLDFLKSDTVNYISQGVGIPVYEEADLIALLARDLPNIDPEAHARFTNNYFYKNGELAVEIIQEEIDRL